MFETLLSQNVCVYVIVMCGIMGVVGRMIMGGCLRKLIRETDSMGRTRKKALREIRKRYEDICSLDVDVRDTAAFVDKYIDRLKIGAVSVNIWNGIIKNFGVIAAGTGIFAGGYQYYVLGDSGEALKMLGCAAAVNMVMLMAGNLWDPLLYMKTLRDGVVSYLGNSLANRLSREDRRQVAASEHVSTKPKEGEKEDSNYDKMLDSMMQKILADG